MNFNPKFKDFLEQNPDISMLKMSWAIFWRIQVVLLPISIIGSLIIAIFAPETTGF